MKCTITFDGDPVPASRPRVSNGHAYYTANYEAARKAWQLEAAVQAKRMFARDKRLAVEVTFWRETRERGDVDNLCKGVMDALSGSVYKDDDQVDELHAVVRRGVGRGNGKTVITVTEIGRTRKHPGLRAELRTRQRTALARALSKRPEPPKTKRGKRRKAKRKPQHALRRIKNAKGRIQDA